MIFVKLFDLCALKGGKYILTLLYLLFRQKYYRLVNSFMQHSFWPEIVIRKYVIVSKGSIRMRVGDISVMTSKY